MPQNRNALIRYKTIDKCLSNHYRRWTLEDLINEVSEALYEYEGIDNGISKRTIQYDIQTMRSDKLGFNAPIVVYERCYYKYSDPDYRITDMPLSKKDLKMLSDSVSFINQFKNYSPFEGLGAVVKKLEDNIYSELEDTEPIMEMDSNELLKGLEFIDSIYKSIQNSNVVIVDYQPFSSRVKKDIIFEPYLLKEFNNRWFVVGKKQVTKEIINLALDRIYELKICEDEFFYRDPNFSSKEYYKHTIGVTVIDRKPKNVKLWIDNYNAPYVLTKPLHKSQQLISQDRKGIEIELRLIMNFELERIILGFGDGIKVLAPLSLQRRIQNKINKASDLYNKEA